MIKTPAQVTRDDRGVAGFEFALVSMVLITLLAGLADFGLAFLQKGLLASAVAEGASYAVLVGPTVTPSSIQNIVGQRLELPASDVAVVAPACYCVSGTPAAATNQDCANPCPDGRNPGVYTRITAKYTYSALLPFYSRLYNPVMTETAMARLR